MAGRNPTSPPVFTFPFGNPQSQPTSPPINHSLTTSPSLHYNPPPDPSPPLDPLDPRPSFSTSSSAESVEKQAPPPPPAPNRPFPFGPRDSSASGSSSGGNGNAPSPPGGEGKAGRLPPPRSSSGSGRNLLTGIRARVSVEGGRPRTSREGSGDTIPEGMESPISSTSSSTPWHMSRSASTASEFSEQGGFLEPGRRVSEVVHPRDDPFDTTPPALEPAPPPPAHTLEGTTPMYEKENPWHEGGREYALAEGGPSTQASRLARMGSIKGKPLPPMPEGDSGSSGQEESSSGVEETDGRGEGEEADATDSLHPPIYTRSWSSPLPVRLGHLRHPRQSVSGAGHNLRQSSVGSLDSYGPTPPLSNQASNKTVPQISTGSVSPASSAALETVSLELADSLQSAIQTLLHLSPPHMLDNTKEQYSGCTVQLPTTSLSAILTAMKKLNYLSAHMQALTGEDFPAGQPPAMSRQGSAASSNAPHKKNLMSPSPSEPKVGSSPSEHQPVLPSISMPLPPKMGLLDNALKPSEDFDIGEMLQSTADLLGGQAAQAGVDLILFHGNPNIKHISVRGDGEGLGYALSHIIRQVLAICLPGDSLELGLLVAPQSPSQTPKVNQPLTAAEIDNSIRDAAQPFAHEDTSGRESPSESVAPEGSRAALGPLLCTFQIVHNLGVPDSAPAAGASSVATPRAEKPEPVMQPVRQDPDFNGLLCKRILRHINATLRAGTETQTPYIGPVGGGNNDRKSYEVSILLARGETIAEPAILTAEEQAARQPYPSVQLAREPTLSELTLFLETLKGKRAEVHSSIQSVFGRHISSYLTAWGMLPVHYQTEEELGLEGPPSVESISPITGANAFGSLKLPGRQSLPEFPHSPNPADPGSSGDSAERFVIIDDDVAVLKKQLLKILSERPSLTLRPKALKRPTLAGRTRSSPQVRNIQDSVSPLYMPPSSQHNNVIVIHFTSLANYNHVRDVVSSILAVTPPSSSPPPDVLVIPKPVGPRRFLTALHTAVNRPLIDPYFTPIANSPKSPGGGYFAGMVPRTPSGLEGVQGRTSYLGNTSEETKADVGGILDANGVVVPPRESPNLLLNGRTADSTRSLHTPAGDVLATPALEYFSDAAHKLGGSSATGVMVQSPDGRPYGMYFEPPQRSENGRRASASGRSDTRRRASARSSISSVNDIKQGGGMPAGASPSARRVSNLSSASAGDPDRKSSLQPVQDDDEGSNESGTASKNKTGTIRRRTTGGQSSQSSLAQAARRERSATITAGPNGKVSSGASSPATAGVNGAIPEMPGGSPLEQVPGSTIRPPGLGERRISKKALAIEALQKARVQAAEAASLLESQKKPKAATVKKTVGGKDALVVPPINVLIVEDNPINQNILSMFLRKKKIKHQAAKDGQEAVEKWRTGTFHLILMDIQLPVMDGIEATKEIRRLEKSNNIGVFPSTPSLEVNKTLSPAVEEVPATPLRSSVIIVALTASSYQTDRVNALAAGCNDFLTKPVSLPWLEAKIVEWGCMQALIDFEGWRRWRTFDTKDAKGLAESKRKFLTSSEAQARSVAQRLRIAPSSKLSRTTPPDPPVASPAESATESGGIAINVTQPTPKVIEAQSDPVHSTLPKVAEDPVIAGDAGFSGVEVLQEGLQAAKEEVETHGTRPQAPSQPEGSSSGSDLTTTPMPGSFVTGSSGETSTAGAKTPVAPPLGERERSTDDRPMSPDIAGEAGEADGGTQPNSNPSSGESTGPTSTSTGQPGARRLSEVDKPLPPLPE